MIIKCQLATHLSISPSHPLHSFYVSIHPSIHPVTITTNISLQRRFNISFRFIVQFLLPPELEENLPTNYDGHGGVDRRRHHHFLFQKQNRFLFLSKWLYLKQLQNAFFQHPTDTFKELCQIVLERQPHAKIPLQSKTMTPKPFYEFDSRLKKGKEIN